MDCSPDLERDPVGLVSVEELKGRFQKRIYPLDVRTLADVKKPIKNCWKLPFSCPISSFNVENYFVETFPNWLGKFFILFDDSLTSLKDFIFSWAQSVRTTFLISTLNCGDEQSWLVSEWGNYRRGTRTPAESGSLYPLVNSSDGSGSGTEISGSWMARKLLEYNIHSNLLQTILFLDRLSNYYFNILSTK